MHIDDLDLTVRSHNCLRQQEITRVGDLVRQTPEQLLAIRNMGRTSLRDVERTLSKMGLRLGMRDADVNEALQIADAGPVRQVEEFVSAMEILRRSDVDRVDTLVYMTPDQLLAMPGVDPTVLEVIENGLQKWGLTLGLRPPGSVTADDLAAGSPEDTTRVYGTFKDELQDTLARLLAPKENQALCFVAYHGVAGAPRRTLQEIADDGVEYGFRYAVTRERVRQVLDAADRGLRKKASNQRFVGWEPALVEARSILPASVPDIVSRFGYESYPDPENNFKTLEHCADIFGLDFPFKVRAIGGIGQIVVDHADEATVEWIARLREEVNGELYAEIGSIARRIDCGEKMLRRIVDASSRLEFLDGGRRYLWKRPPLPPQNFRITGNNILTNLCKVFSATSRAEILDLVRSIPRNSRVRSAIPYGTVTDLPVPVLEGIAERSGLFDVQDGEVRRRPGPAWCSIGGRDLALLEICVENGRVVSSNVIYTRLVREGLTSENARATIAYSPFLVHTRPGVGYKEGIYKFVPRPEDIDLDGLHARISTDDVSDCDDVEEADMLSDVCLRIPISSRTRLSGRFSASDVIGLTGQWQVQDPTGADIGRIVVYERSVAGLESVIAALQLGNGDVLELRPDGDGIVVVSGA